MRPPPADPARPSPAAADDDLDLPALDGEIEDGEKTEVLDAHEDFDVRDDGGDAFDDATGEGDPVETIVVEGAEGGWLDDAEDASSIDVGGFDLSLGGDDGGIGDDDAAGAGADDDLDLGDESVTADSGEEGPLADDEELREEDLPALDADDDGEIADEALYDRSLIGEDELRWDDRAWARAPAADAVDEAADDSGILAVPGDDPENAARDAAWRRFDESGQLTAAALLPGGSVVVALDTSDRAVIVRIRPDGVALIIAEIEAPGGGDGDTDASPARVVSLRWDATHGVLVASGAFGVQAFKPV